MALASSTLTQVYLAEKYPANLSDENLCINGAIAPDKDLLTALDALSSGDILRSQDGRLIACLLGKDPDLATLNNLASGTEGQTYGGKLLQLQHLSDLFVLNDQAISADFEDMTRGRTSASLSKTNILLGDNVFIEEGARVEASTLNTENGPIYIGKDAEVMEGCHIRGPFALGEHATLKMDTKIYGASTVGPYSKVGGEVNNSVIMGYSNKGHDGFIGNSVIGYWCNLGADTNTSNLKNNYSEVKLWDYDKEAFEPTGLTFCGLFMGDHSKCGINTMFNTGTVVGVSANIFGSGFPRNFIPSYSWGGAAGVKEYTFEKAMEVAQIVMQRRDIKLTDIDKKILKEVFDQTTKHR